MKKYSANFHQTFYANLDYVSKILQLSDGVTIYEIDDISSNTGIPTGKSSGKVVPHILYAKYMNLIKIDIKKGKYILTRTMLGDVILKEDIYMSEGITKLICHYFLTSKFFGADQWFYMYRVSQIKYGSNVAINIVLSDSESSLICKLKVAPFNGCYVNASSFSSLNLLNIEHDVYDFLEYKERCEDYYAILYCMICDLERLDSSRKEFTEHEIFEELLWHKAFNWTHKQATSFLEKATIDGYLKMNKQLVPMTILVKVPREIILEKIFSMLI